MRAIRVGQISTNNPIDRSGGSAASRSKIHLPPHGHRGRSIEELISHRATEMHENKIATAVDLAATVRNEALISAQFRLPLNERWNHTNHSRTALNTPPCLSASVRNLRDRTKRSSGMEYHLLTFNVRSKNWLSQRRSDAQARD